ncbi:phosphate regulon sensor histidine kinase PhoR [Endozoicomonas sp. Mp262]|uniref:phosphate regulon sensor histidine kinase PhoR n=1 Tax=Endozoicomonas sp. Mp262 TaxID=2919499 RepID=UPI0021DA59BB
MITYSRSLLLGRLLLGLAIGTFIGWGLGHVLLGITLVLAVYLLWSLSQLFRLLTWLEKTAVSELEPPESRGLWGAIFDGIYRIQKRQKGSHERLQGVIDRIQESTAALEDGIVMADNNGGLEWWNRAAGDLLGLKMPGDRGQLLTNLVRDPSFLDYFDSGRYEEAIELASPVNTERQLQINITIYGMGSRLLFIRDITRINQLETMRKDFVANVSHELRTPLTVIAGYLETLLDNADIEESLSPMWCKALKRMQQQSARMKNLVADLLLLSRLESATSCESNPVKLEELLNQVADDARSLSGSDDHEITLEGVKGIYLKGSQSELRSALSNLVFNAVRYTQAGGVIHIGVKVKNQECCISVEDNGVGIDPVHIPRLTERFYRVDKGRSLESGGTGLGLAIVKHVLLRHDGWLTISSHPGQGSCFICHFPENRFSSVASVSHENK